MTATSGPDDPVPRAVRALWGDGAGPRRGPKPALSVAGIAAAAIELADADGLAAVSMAAVGKRLGFTTMSLYRYLDSKEDLQQVMVDVALGSPPVLEPRLGWRRQIDGWARTEHARLAAHPWMLEVRLGSPPLGPNSLAWMDLGMQVLGRSGLGAQQAASSLLLVDGYVRTQAVLAQQYADAEGTRLWAVRVRTLVDPERYPALGAALSDGVFDDPPPGRPTEDEPETGFPTDEFEFGLALVLDGIAELARRRT